MGNEEVKLSQFPVSMFIYKILKNLQMASRIPKDLGKLVGIKVDISDNY